MKKIALFASSIALAATPVLADTQIAVEPTTSENNLGEGANIAGLIFAALAAGLIIAAVISSENDDDPISA